MTDPNPNPVEGGEKQDPVGGSPDPATPAQPFKAFATEDDYKAFEAKRAEKHEREMKALRKELDTLKATTLTEEQRAAEAQKAAIEAERVKMFEEADRKAGFIGVALSNGLTRDQAAKWYGLAGSEWNDPQEAFTAVQKSLGVDMTKKQPVAGGGGRNTDAADVAYTPEFVEEMIFKNGPGWYAVNRPKIQAWQTAHAVGGIRKL